MKTIRKFSSVIACTLTAASLAVPAFAQQDEAVDVVLKEWEIATDKTEVRAGPVTFHVHNRGDERHELVILKTELQPGSLPTEGGKVHEDDAGVLVDEIEDLDAGATRSATFELAPGAYVLLCNIVEQEDDGEIESHYHQGMRLAFTAR